SDRTLKSELPFSFFVVIIIIIIIYSIAATASSNEMAHQSSSSPGEVHVGKITVQNNYGENLVGLLHETGSTELVILCHGLGASKEETTMGNLADAITKEGISVFRFDFAGNGESEGSFQFGNYLRDVDDLRSVVLYFSGGKHAIITVLGHSKGGNVVLLYASKYHDVPTIVNVSGRYDLKKGIDDRFGKDFLQNIKRDGFVDVMGKR
ncbi:Alpha/beta-Hydrolases superfamily protein, partial [Thalictrum thalictroides]